MNDIVYQAILALAPLFIAALGWLAKKGADYIAAKTKNEYLKGVLIRLDDSVYTAVKSIAQTYVDVLKKASEDGTLTAEEKAAAKSEAVAMVKGYVGTKGLEEIMRILGLSTIAQAEQFLGDRVEAAVLDVKAASPQ